MTRDDKFCAGCRLGLPPVPEHYLDGEPLCPGCYRDKMRVQVQWPREPRVNSWSLPRMPATHAQPMARKADGTVAVSEGKERAVQR